MMVKQLFSQFPSSNLGFLVVEQKFQLDIFYTDTNSMMSNYAAYARHMRLTFLCLTAIDTLNQSFTDSLKFQKDCIIFTMNQQHVLENSED